MTVDLPGEALPGEALTGAAAGAVVLRLGPARYAVAMAEVAEVTTVPPTTRVPGAPAWLTGVANWRGRMLPVVDLRLLLGHEVSPLPTSARLVVVAPPGQHALTVGVVAEAVPGTYDQPLDAMQPPPPTLPADAARLLRGQVLSPAGPVGVLDVDGVVTLRDRLTRRDTAHAL